MNSRRKKLNRKEKKQKIALSECKPPPKNSQVRQSGRQEIKKRKDKESEWKRQKIRRGDQTFALPKIRNNHCDRRGVVRRKREVQTPPPPQ